MHYYRLRATDEVRYDIKDINPDKEYILEILQFPFQSKKKTTTKYSNDSVEKCIEILHREYNVKMEDITRGRNIYCPIHEDPKRSKTPSSKFNVKSGFFTCFSSNCKIAVNSKTGYRQLSATQFLKQLTKKL